MFPPGGQTREADLPAEQPEAQEEARVPYPDADPSRAGGAQGAPRPRPFPALGLIHTVRNRATFAALARAPMIRRGVIGLRAVAVPGGHTEIAFSVSRRVGNAVVRNRVRRRLRELVRARMDRLTPGHAYLISVAPAGSGTSFQDLSAQLDAALAGLPS
jgi:ribonuclease P protein component